MGCYTMGISRFCSFGYIKVDDIKSRIKIMALNLTKNAFKAYVNALCRSGYVGQCVRALTATTVTAAGTSAVACLGFDQSGVNTLVAGFVGAGIGGGAYVQTVQTIVPALADRVARFLAQRSAYAVLGRA